MADTQEPVATPPTASDAAPAPDGSLAQPPERRGTSQTGVSVGGLILVGIGGLLVIAAIALGVVHLTQRGKDGFYTASTVQATSRGYAITAEGLHIANLPSVTNDIIGTLRVSARSNNGRALFVGIAASDDVNRYLGAVARSQVTDVNNSTLKYQNHAGIAPIRLPGSQTFWHASSSGTGPVTATWKVKGGDWTIVLMNANGSRNVTAAVTAGAKTNLVLWIGLGLLVLGLIFGASGAAMLVSRQRRQSAPPPVEPLAQ